MRRVLIFVLMGLLTLCVTGALFASGGTEKANVSSSGGWVPYFMRPDFKAYVPLPIKTKAELGDVPDEGTVMPVDHVSPKVIHIGFIGAATNPVWDVVQQGEEDAADLLLKHNVKVDWIVPGTTLSATDVATVVDALLVKKYDAIVLQVYNAGEIPYVVKAVNQGVPIAVMAIDTPPNEGLFFVGQDLIAAGAKCADLMAQAIGGKGKIAIITGWANVTAHILRVKGFVDQVNAKYPGITIVGQTEAKDQAELTRSQAMDFMTANPDLAGMYCVAGGPIGAGQAVIDAGKVGKVKIIAYDPLPETLKYVKDGDITAVVGQDLYGEGRDSVIRLANYLLDGTLPPAHNMYTRADVVTQENLDAFMKSGARP